LISDKRGFEYYTYDALNKVFEKKVLNNYAIDDCLDNYTDFVLENLINPDESSFKWYNHDLHQDILYYGNNVDNKWPFNPSFKNNNIQKTYCCLPPDFLYCCRNTVEINNIFTNSNIIGVIPRNLTKTIKNTVISNIFTNVNIMPNIEYYYDINGGLNDQILNEIKESVDIDYGVDSDSDNDIISNNYTVVFTVGGTTNLPNKTADQIAKFIKDNSYNISGVTYETKYYKCTNIEYQNGKVSSITFTE
jgi:hypothetical protein